MEEALCEDLLVKGNVADVVDDVVDDVVVVVDLDQSMEVIDTVIIERKHNDNTKDYSIETGLLSTTQLNTIM